MKRIIVPIIIVISAVMLTACATDTLRVETAPNSSPSDASETADKSSQINEPDLVQQEDTSNINTSLKTVYEQMATSALLPEMTSEDSSTYGFDSSDYSDAVFYKSSDDSLPDEVVLVTANDEEAAEKIEEMLYTRLDEKAENAKNSSKQQYAIITACSVERNGNNLALIISAKAEQLTNSYLENIN